MAYQWAFRDNEMLNSHIKYHQDMTAYLHQLQAEGPELCEDMPRKPKGNIQSLLGIEKSSTKLAGRELHEYLKTRIDEASTSLEVKWNPEDLTHIKETLVVGYKVLQRHHANTLATSIDYGYFLNRAFDFFNHEKDKGQVAPYLTFQHWLADNVGISDSYARKLRKIAVDFYEYRRLRKLGITFTEFWQRKEQIKGMMSVFPDVGAFWKCID